MNVGIVYRIFYGDLSYIGSTINLRKRIRNHISKKDCSSKEIICFDDFEVEILAEIYYVENKNDINLKNLERECMEQYVCVNKYRAIVTKEERKEEKKEYQKEYHKSDTYKEYQKEYHKSDTYKEYRKEYQNSDTYKEYRKEYDKKYQESDTYKEYRENNKEHIAEYQKEYKKSDKYKEYQKEYYLNNKAT
jgi:hypothetical protein